MRKTKEKKLWELRCDDLDKAIKAVASGYDDDNGGQEAVKKAFRNTIQAVEDSGKEEFTLTGEAKRMEINAPNGEFGVSALLECEEVNCPIPPLFILGSMLVDTNESGSNSLKEPGEAYELDINIDKESFVELLEFQAEVVVPSVASVREKPKSIRYANGSWMSPRMGIA